MTDIERHVLYALARWLSGPVTEIGSWLGLSTVALAQGIRDGGSVTKLDTYDLALTEKNFRMLGAAESACSWMATANRAASARAKSTSVTFFWFLGRADHK
jgi:predicted O-methyltransferase YrrM